MWGKCKKGRSGSGGVGVRVDVNEELKFFCKIQKSRDGGRQAGRGIRVDVKEKFKLFIVKMEKSRGGGSPAPVGRWGLLVARLGVGCDVGYGGCEPRIEGIVQCT